MRHLKLACDYKKYVILNVKGLSEIKSLTSFSFVKARENYFDLGFHSFPRLFAKRDK